MELKVYAKLGEQIIPINNNYFRPEAKGDYQIVIDVIDTIGQKESYVHDISIDSYDLPVFIEDSILPKYLVEDSTYELDDLKGFDYNTMSYIETNIYVTDGNGSNQKVENNLFNFKADENGQAKITYKATNNKGSKEISYVIDVIKVKKSIYRYECIFCRG